jgi:hypothetical protein
MHVASTPITDQLSTVAAAMATDLDFVAAILTLGKHA